MFEAVLSVLIGFAIGFVAGWKATQARAKRLKRKKYLQMYSQTSLAESRRGRR